MLSPYDSTGNYFRNPVAGRNKLRPYRNPSLDFINVGSGRGSRRVNSPTSIFLR